MVNKKIHVLLVEDNLLEAEFVRELMFDQNVEFVTARSIQEAGEELSKSEPDVILLDMTLPDSDGLETVERMLQLSSAPVIILTGHDDIDLALQSVNIGAADHITKGTFNSDFLTRTMLYAIERKNVLKRLNLQSKSAEALMSCPSVADALEEIIKSVCKELGWDFGCFFYFDERADAVVKTRWPVSVAQSFLKSGEFKAHKIEGSKTESQLTSARRSFRTTKFINLGEIAPANTVEEERQTQPFQGHNATGLSASQRWHPQPAVDIKSTEIISDLATFCATRHPTDSSTKQKFDLSHCQAAIKAGMRSGMFVPIVTYDTLFGVIEFFSTKEHDKDDQLIRHLTVLGSQIAHAILRERAEQALLVSEKNERKFANHVIRHASAGIARLDTRLEVIDTNEAFLRIINTDPNPEGKCLFRILPFLPAEEIRKSIENRQTYTVNRLRRAGASGEDDQFLSFSIWPITGDEDEVVGAAAMVADDTPQVCLEQQKEDLVAAVAHDIKNPLIGAERVLKGLCEDFDYMPDDSKRSVSSLLSSTRNLIRLVQNLVDMYRYDSIAHCIQPEHVRAIPLLRQCIEQLKPFALSNEITLYDEISPDTPDLYADEVAISRVILNLMYNAIKFTTPGGEVILSSSAVDGHVLFRVTDTGIGLHPSEQGILFRRFFQGRTGKRLQSGTGLGLYISKLIVDAHHGEIDFRSEPGQGTTVSVKLPVYAAITTERATIS